MFSWVRTNSRNSWVCWCNWNNYRLCAWSITIIACMIKWQILYGPFCWNCSWSSCLWWGRGWRKWWELVQEHLRSSATSINYWTGYSLIKSLWLLMKFHEWMLNHFFSPLLKTDVKSGKMVSSAVLQPAQMAQTCPPSCCQSSRERWQSECCHQEDRGSHVFQ